MAWFCGHSENAVLSIIRFTFMPFYGLDSTFNKKKGNIF
jgi:hypothetical protein